MRINKCWFCSSSIYPGHGVKYVRSDCAVFNFCRGKCMKLFKKRLNPRKIKWTKIHRKIANKELTDDPILGFEKRVHIPVIYNREVLLSTLDAIPKIAAIKQRRDDIFVSNRILGKQEESKERDLKFIEKYQRLLVPASKDKEAIRTMKKKEERFEFN